MILNGPESDTGYLLLQREKLFHASVSSNSGKLRKLLRS